MFGLIQSTPTPPWCSKQYTSNGFPFNQKGTTISSTMYLKNNKWIYTILGNPLDVNFQSIQHQVVLGTYLYIRFSFQFDVFIKVMSLIFFIKKKIHDKTDSWNKRLKPVN